MRLTTRGRYAVTALLDVALNQQHGPVPIADVAKRRALSKSYLEQLFTQLRKKALVDSIRGPGGGYKISKRVDQVTIAEIMIAIEEPVDITSCSGAKNCEDGDICLTHNLWAQLNNVIFNYLNGVTLASLIDESGGRVNEIRIPFSKANLMSRKDDHESNIH